MPDPSPSDVSREPRDPPPEAALHSDLAIGALLADLNVHVRDHLQLQPWLDRSVVETARVVNMPELTYIRLAQHDADRIPVVVMLLDGIWERAL
ncbi:hypothetical protein AA0Z99_05700 [Agrococcus sp. 1P02AA]|uniref:hypothetical protein n=1 Tax=Agrococcus sp. 1P02AA TaxID=3132259 RepID=UPI0039A543A2